MKKFEIFNQREKVCVTTEFDETNNWIYANWVNVIKEEDIKAWADPFINLLEETGCPNLLNSNLEIRSTWLTSTQWVATELIPRCINAGLKNYAHIVPDHLFGQIAAQDLERKIKDYDFTMRIFNNVEEAKQWLKSGG